FNSFEKNNIKLAIQKCFSGRIPGFLTETKLVKSMLLRSDRLLALNSKEALLLGRYFEVPSDKISIIPNGIDTSLLEGTTVASKQNLILCVGEVCTRKNQLSLIRACRELDYKLAIVGPMKDAKYKNLCE